MNKEGETALGLDGEKAFSPAKMIRRRSSFQRKGHFQNALERGCSLTENVTVIQNVVLSDQAPEDLADITAVFR